MKGVNGERELAITKLVSPTIMCFTYAFSKKNHHLEAVQWVIIINNTFDGAMRGRIICGLF